MNIWTVVDSLGPYFVIGNSVSLSQSDQIEGITKQTISSQFASNPLSCLSFKYPQPVTSLVPTKELMIVIRINHHHHHVGRDLIEWASRGGWEYRGE